MLRLSKLTDYGTVIMSHMARRPAGLHSAGEIALALGVAAPTVSKVLKRLTRAELLQSVRGAQGADISKVFKIEQLLERGYQQGFHTPLEADTVARGLNEDVIRLISAKKDEPEFLRDWRLKAYRHWLTMREPHWATVRHPPID